MKRRVARPSLADRARAAIPVGAILAIMIVLLATELLVLSLGYAAYAQAARLAFVALCLVSIPFVTIRELALLTGAVLFTLAVWFTGGGTQDVAPALDLAAFFGAFIATLTAMRDVAERSRSVHAVGRFLTHQPAGRRFYATAVGGHVLGVFLNFGAISLMSPLIQTSAKTPEGAPSPDLERRQLSALIRGFAWVLLWAPTTLTQALLLTIFIEVTWWEIAPLGISTAVLMIVVGRIYDRFEWRHRALPGAGQAAPVPWREIIRVLAICVLLIAVTFTMSGITGLSIAQSLLFVVPVVTVSWLQVQLHQSQVGGFAPVRLPSVLAPSTAALARSAVALGLSGYIGRMAAQSLPVERWADLLDLASVPGWLFLATLPVLITLGGQVALSPILIVVFIGEVLRGVEALPTGQMQILFALSLGWALSMTASPNATATLLISGACRIPATTLTWGWNLRYGLLCYAIAVAIFALIA